ncbi:ferritin [bacterium]|nr:ferritin [bacterium]
MNTKIQNAIEEQINAELYSAYLYLAMKSYFKEVNLLGFANWFDVQVQEEYAHAMGLYDYVYERGGTVEMKAIDKPVVEGNCPLSIYEHVLRHEQLVTSKINALADVIEGEGDRAGVSFIDWYVKEQVEEEATVIGIIKTLKLIGDDKKALLMLDKDLATRTFVAPVIG